MSSHAEWGDLSSIRIPSLPGVVARLQRMLADPNAGLAEIGAVVATDPPLAAKVLRTANSAAYGLREPVQTLHRAITVLGIRALRNIVLQVCLVDEFAHLANDERINLERLWRHSIAAAMVAQSLGTRAGTRLVDPYDAYTCALLHDLGKLVLFETEREPYAAIIQEADALQTTTYSIERERLGFTHAEVGGLLARQWGLPDDIVQSIRLHHADRKELMLSPMAALVSLSDNLVLGIEAGEVRLQLIEHAAARLLQIDEQTLWETCEHVLEIWPTIGL